MVLKATKTVKEEVENTPVAPAQGTSLPAKAPASNVPANNTDRVSVADMNAGILEGMDGIGDSNRVGIDGTDFEYKNQDRRERELMIVVSYGRRLYQYWDDNNTLCQSFDGKISTDNLVCATCEFKRSKACKFKFEIRWIETDAEGEQTEYIMTLPTVSAIAFVDYVKGLAKQGYGVGQVITKLTIERRQQPNTNIKYSAVVFDSVSVLE